MPIVGIDPDPDEVERGAAVYYAARAAHEAVRAWCMCNADPLLAPEWEAPASAYRSRDSLRASAIAGVEGVIAGHGPEAQHEAWMRHRIANGWTYGPEKDSGKKSHPNLVPYAELSAEQKKKDQIFIGVARVMLQAAGIQCKEP